MPASLRGTPGAKRPPAFKCHSMSQRREQCTRGLCHYGARGGASPSTQTLLHLLPPSVIQFPRSQAPSQRAGRHRGARQVPACRNDVQWREMVKHSRVREERTQESRVTDVPRDMLRPVFRFLQGLTWAAGTTCTKGLGCKPCPPRPGLAQGGEPEATEQDPLICPSQPTSLPL